jgi:hypothetical protein
MIDWIGYGWIAGEVTGPSTWFGDLTLELPRGDVLAAAAVTELSVRVEEPEPGSVAVYVREYAQYDVAGKPRVVDVPADPTNDVLAIHDCFFVRFRMTLFQGSAYARGVVFHHAQATTAAAIGTAAPSWSVRDYRFSIGGSEIGVHRVMTLSRRSVLPVDELLGRSAAEAARHFGVKRREIETRPARRRGARREAPARLF